VVKEFEAMDDDDDEDDDMPDPRCELATIGEEV
jgi:hypothetical protein